MSEIEKNNDWVSHKATILTPEGEIKDVVIKTICSDEETAKEYRDFFNKSKKVVKLRKE